MNLGTTVAVYASLCKHLDIPFVFPGNKKAYQVFQDATDADLLAEHLIWEATNPKCANQVSLKNISPNLDQIFYSQIINCKHLLLALQML